MLVLHRFSSEGHAVLGAFILLALQARSGVGLVVPQKTLVDSIHLTAFSSLSHLLRERFFSLIRFDRGKIWWH